MARPQHPRQRRQSQRTTVSWPDEVETDGRDASRHWLMRMPRCLIAGGRRNSLQQLQRRLARRLADCAQIAQTMRSLSESQECDDHSEVLLLLLQQQVVARHQVRLVTKGVSWTTTAEQFGSTSLRWDVEEEARPAHCYWNCLKKIAEKEVMGEWHGSMVPTYCRASVAWRLERVDEQDW